VSDSFDKQKAELRQRIRSRSKCVSPAQRSAASAQACALLEQQTVWKNAGVIFFYAPMPDELDVWPLLRDSVALGKTVCLPRFDPGTERYVACAIKDAAGDIRTGQFGIREPNLQCVAVPLNRLDLVLVPGVAYDLRGRRLGRGKGFYDRLLVDVSGIKCGIAFDEQIVNEIPIEPHDVLVNCILTPTRWIQP
jgi:5-formyltetrahydrofolate cyclo-ligase